ncbi:hypothetical protein RBU61_03325 [Tissierella sp. MB52-C2]|uniref:hypothetical protein n=1 Tax=Tissierella sp. MB52-C2 TaxID=3070999 RepID=UPI00280C0FAD|nr:hypothetical protein [Tissierella sp. MB52-C2]WMM25711.1 hypothetical protein RBU61_03325 [Tissierella sp. MB52-C2]
MKRIKLSILFITILFILSGCRSIKNQSVKFEKQDKAPNSLRDISAGLQDIFKNIEKVEKILDGTYIEEKTSENKNKQEEPEKKQGGDQGGGQGQNSGGQGSGNQGGSTNQGANSSQGNEAVTITIEERKKKEEQIKEKNREELLKTWQQVDKKIEDIHKKWNQYEPEGMKKGVTVEKVDSFRLSLNSLTKSIEERNLKEIYDYGSQSMLNLVPMISLYRDDIGGEINKIKYATYQAYINAIEEKNPRASELLKSVEEDVDKMRLKFEKDDAKVKIVEKIKLSIEDMRKSLAQKSVKLTRIKKDIIIENLGDIEK